MKNTWRQRYSLIIPIVSLLLIAVIMIFATSRNWNETVVQMEEELGAQVLNQASLLCNKMDSNTAVLSGLATTFTRENTESVDNIIEKLRTCTEKTDFVTISFINEDGYLYRSDGRELDVSDRWYFQKGMKGENFIVFLENNEMDASPKVGMGVPIRIDGAVSSILLGTYDTETFQKIFEKCILNNNDFSYICSSDGSFITGTQVAEAVMEEHEPGFIQNGNFFDVLAKSDYPKGSIEFIKANMAIMSGGQVVYTLYGEKRYTSYEPLGINDWFMISVLPEEQIYMQAMREASFSYIMLAVIMLVIVGMILYLAYYEHKQALKEKKRVREMQYHVEHDDLTGVLCDKVFMQRVEEKMNSVSPEEYCIIYLDIYKFKLINEMFGYEKGDELLCVLAEELNQIAWDNGGLCGRISGDKYVLFLPHREDVINIFKDQKNDIRKLLPIEIYLYYGVYVIKDTTIPVNRMVDYAQLAQKAVKGNYDNYVSYYDERIKEKIVKEQEIISSMTQALEDGEFIIYLQPQYNYREGTINGAEALVRWNHPERGLIPPGEFIPVFETNGFIIKLDENVWEQVCKLLRKWLDEGKKPLPISVNVSRADLLKGSVAEKIKKLITKYNLTSDLIRVEVTESAYMDNPKQLIMEIDKLRDNGLQVEIDDFGSGYSSLNMLKDVPIQVLKTDLKFLEETGIEARKERILDSVINMAHQMGMIVIAEGVETKEQADYLLKLNCENMQGYYFSRPVPVEEFERIVF